MKLLNYTNEVLNTRHVSAGEQYYSASESEITVSDKRAYAYSHYKGICINLDGFRDVSPCGIYELDIRFSLAGHLNSDKYKLALNSSDINGVGISYLYFNESTIDSDSQGNYIIDQAYNNRDNVIKITFMKFYNYNGNMQLIFEILYDEKMTNLYIGNDQTDRILSDYYNYRLNIEHRLSESRYYDTAKSDGSIKVGRCTVNNLEVWMSDSYYGIQINFNNIYVDPCTQQEVVFVVDFRKKIKSSKYNLEVGFTGLMYYKVYMDDNMISSSSNKFNINNVSNDEIHYIRTTFIKTGSAPYWLYINITYKEEETIVNLPNASNKRLIDNEMNELNISHNSMNMVPSFTYFVDEYYYRGYVYASTNNNGLSIEHQGGLHRYEYQLTLDFSLDSSSYDEVELCLHSYNRYYNIDAKVNCTHLEIGTPIKFYKSKLSINFIVESTMAHPTGNVVLDLDILIKNDTISVNKYLK